MFRSLSEADSFSEAKSHLSSSIDALNLDMTKILFNVARVIRY